MNNEKSDENSNYELEIKKLVEEKVISEKTAQIHLRDLQNQVIDKDS